MDEYIFLVTLRSFADEYTKLHEDIKWMKALYNNIDSKELEDYFKLTGGSGNEYKINIESSINELEDMLEQYNCLRLKFCPRIRTEIMTASSISNSNLTK